MMYKELYTDRLILRLLNKKWSEQVLDFLKENRDDFLKYEAEKPSAYFTKFYQEYILQNEYEASMKKGYLRYYIFEKNEPDSIIGTVSVGQIKGSPYCSGILGYKMAVRKKNLGYATEAVNTICQVAYEYLGLHRLEAFVQEENRASVRVLEKCGFLREGLCRKNLCVNGVWTDHLLYGKVME